MSLVRPFLCLSSTHLIFVNILFLFLSSHLASPVSSLSFYHHHLSALLQKLPLLIHKQHTPHTIGFHRHRSMIQSPCMHTCSRPSSLFMHPITLPSLTPLLAGYLRQTVPYFSKHKVKATAICVLLCTNSWHIDSPLAQRERKQADVNTSFLPRLSSAPCHGSWIFLFCWFSVFFIFLANIIRFVHLQKKRKSLSVSARARTFDSFLWGMCVTLDCSYRGLPDVSPEVKEGSHLCTCTHTRAHGYIKTCTCPFSSLPPPHWKRVGRKRNGCLDMDCWDWIKNISLRLYGWILMMRPPGENGENGLSLPGPWKSLTNGMRKGR